VGKDAAEAVNSESVITEDPNTAPKRWQQTPERDETDLMIETVQVTEPYVDGQDNVDNRVHSREQAVDNERT
jgi:hypothetical protein